MTISPTQRSLALLRKDGWTVDVTERWIPGMNVRKDFLGFVDLIALRGGETLAVQATSDNGGNMAARVAKIKASPNLPIVLAAGWAVCVLGWRKKANRWIVRRVNVEAECIDTTGES